ncbi:MAG: dockerin type I domain-containing protein [Phycisphaerales bacterium]|nr:dockerin type I domain-containing protein [Phycisphaerales bacterium]
MIACIAVGAAGVSAVGESPFASRVVEYAPAPGQFVDDADFNDPTRALGPPQGGGTSQPNNASVVTLGGFGGSITLAFDHTVMDDPLNPFGLDAIVFGNAYWVGGNRDRHWAECATIEISLDANGNGLADDPWYILLGSHLEWPADDYALPADLFGANVVVNPNAGTEVEGIYGYAEYAPTLLLGDTDADNLVDDFAVIPEMFYTVPDDPFEVGITPGSGGGDAFDIAWAIDPLTGEPAHLPGFDFIRITTAVDSVSPIFGEKSAEIDAVADVSADRFGDADDDGDIDLADVAALQNCFGAGAGAVVACQRMDRNGDERVDALDGSALVTRIMGPG